MIDESGHSSGFGVVGMTTLEEIKKALEGVTPGPWFEGDKWVFVSPRSGSSNEALENVLRNNEAQANASYIAAVNPASISELLSTLESLQRENEALKEENGSLLDENSDLRNEPWPEWAKAVLKVVRSHTGYDGYDDATEGVDMPLELEEHLSELQSVNDRLQSRAEAAEAEVKRYREALIAAKTRMRNCRGAIESDQVVDKDVHGSLQNGIRDIQEALASTGGEHHAE